MTESEDDPPTGYIIVDGKRMAYWGTPIKAKIPSKAPVQIDLEDYLGERND